MKKVFASDFDGTLYFYKAEVKLPPESVEKIKEYQAAGNYFGLCTGRQVGGLTPFIGGFFEPDFWITSTGSNIIDKDMKEIRKLFVDRDVIDRIVKDVKPRGNRISIDIDGVINVFEEMDYPGEYNVITGMDDAPEGMVHGVGIHCETLEEAAALTAEINEKYGDYLNAFQNVIEVDIAPKGTSKGEAISVIRQSLWHRRLPERPSAAPGFRRILHVPLCPERGTGKGHQDRRYHCRRTGRQYAGRDLMGPAAGI